jgi:hypothetical protein
MALTPFGFDKFAMPLIADDAAHIGMKTSHRHRQA